MNPWLTDAASRLARAVDGDPDLYALSPADVETLLEVARAAAHESGDRTNAPLLCYLLGLARGRSEDRSLSDLARRATGGQ